MGKTTANDRSERKKSPRKITVQPLPRDAGSVIDTIYREQEGDSDRSLKKIERQGTRLISKRLLIALGVFGLLVGAAAVGFFTFNREQRFNEKGVTLSVEVPSTVSSAGEATVTYTIKNDESVGIRNTELSVSSPDGWTFKRSDPQPSDADSTLWKISGLPAHAQRSVKVTGSIVGEVGTVKTFSAAVTYRPVNFNYDFTSRASASVTIGSSILQLEVKGPTQAAPGATVSYALTYRNASGDPLRGLRLVATYPDGFQKKKLNPKPREGDNLWVVDELTSGTSGTVTIEGSFGGTAGDSQELSFRAELQRGSSVERQVETSIVVVLISSTLNLSLTVNGQSGASVAAPGDKLSYVLSYKNESDLDIQNVVLTANVDGSALKSGSFSDDYGAAFKDGSVNWDTKLVPDLASIKPGASGSIRFSVNVSDAPKPESGAKGPFVVAQASVSLAFAGSNTNKPETVKLDSLETKVTSRVSLNVDPRYYGDDGEQLGSGPLPPQTGKTTTYRVSWYLGNTTNELKDIVVKAIVPSSVYWTGKGTTTTAGDLSFDPNSRILTWTLNRLPANVGQDASTIAASFEVSVTPAGSDVGSALTLLQGTTLTAADTYTGTTITVQRDPATTNLPNDLKASGKGLVVSAT